MKCKVNFRNVEKDPAVREYIQKRLTFALTRVEHLVRNINVTVTDVNGPKGGVDMQCRVVLTSDVVEPVVISERRSTLREAIDGGVSRASHSLIRQLKRHRQKTRVERGIAVALSPS